MSTCLCPPLDAETLICPQNTPRMLNYGFLLDGNLLASATTFQSTVREAKRTLPCRFEMKYMRLLIEYCSRYRWREALVSSFWPRQSVTDMGNSKFQTCSTWTPAAHSAHDSSAFSRIQFWDVPTWLLIRLVLWEIARYKNIKGHKGWASLVLNIREQIAIAPDLVESIRKGSLSRRLHASAIASLKSLKSSLYLLYHLLCTEGMKSQISLPGDLTWSLLLSVYKAFATYWLCNAMSRLFAMYFCIFKH